MELEAGSGKAARRTGRLNNDRGPARMLTFHFPHVRFHSGEVTVMPQGNRVNGRDGALAATSPSSPALCRGPSPARIVGIGRIPQIDAAIGPRHKAGDDGEGKPAVRRRHSPDCPGPPHAVTLDIDDTVDVVHGHQQLSLFNGHYDERCFLPIHVYDTATSRPVAMLLRPGATPSGEEVRNHLRRLVRRIRRHWPDTRLTIRGDGHYGRPEVMSWCEDNGVDYILGLPGNKVLDRLVEPVADAVRVRRALSQAPVFRRCAETRYGAKSWRCERRVAARIEVTQKGLDIRYVVTNIARGTAEWLYETLYCARGQAENLIKLHKTQLASDRTSCRSPLANQVRIILHTAAYWLMLKLRDAIPRPQPLANAEFTTLRLRLIKIAARVMETASRVRVAFAAAHPEADLFASLARCLHPGGP